LLANRPKPTEVIQAFAIWVHANSNGRIIARRIAEAFNVTELHKHSERDPHAVEGAQQMFRMATDVESKRSEEIQELKRQVSALEQELEVRGIRAWGSTTRVFSAMHEEIKKLTAREERAFLAFLHRRFPRAV
jgi:hypothetical protein